MLNAIVITGLTVMLMTYVALMHSPNFQTRLALDFGLLSALVLYLVFRLGLQRRRRQSEENDA